MKIGKLAALAALAGMLSMMAPAPPAAADGAASTRNILIGGAAAALIILNHNRKVHEKYAEYDRQEAALAAQRNDAQAAYQAERSAYEHEVAVNGSLKSELAYQQNEISGLKRQLASSTVTPKQYTATAVTKVPGPVGTQKVALVSYGWGTF